MVWFFPKRKNKERRSFVQAFLNIVEKAGNALPHPATLFLLFAVMALFVSWIGHLLDWQAVHPGTGETVSVKNLLSVEGLHFVLLTTVDNFTGFAPLGIVLVAMLGIGIAEKSGLIGACIRVLVLSAPTRILTFVLVLAGVLSNVASDVGYVLLIPLAGIVFLAVGRHPVVGMAAAFAGVSGGFSANLVLGTIDPLLAGLSEEAAQIVDPSYSVNPTANYYFMVVSTFLITAAGTWVTEKIVAPRLGEYTPEEDVEPEEVETLSKREKAGLLHAALAMATLAAVMVIGLVPPDGFFRGEDGTLLGSPLIRGVVTLLFLGAAIAGIIYGFTVRVYRSDSDVMKGMAESMKSMATYIVLVFFAAQFVAYFKESNLGIIAAVKGAETLKALDLNVYLLMVLFIIFAASINMLMGSASAKWAIMAPVLVPIFMLMGYSPELSQVVYRIGDSVTNIISPMMSFFALIIAFIQKYDSRAGIGTIISVMLPYSIVFFVIWSALLMVWIMLGLPLGPGAGLNYSPQ